MRPAVAIPVALLLLAAGWWGAWHPNVLAGFIDDVRPAPSTSEEDRLVGLQSVERWFVVVVQFSDAPNGPDESLEAAEALLTGAVGAADFFDELSGGTSELVVDIHQEILTAPSPSTDYGHDGEGRDSGQLDSGSPPDLASWLLIQLRETVDWSRYDLDDDGRVDRLLILHTADAQEDGGRSSDIWSHFGPLPRPVDVGDRTAHHYTMAAFESGLGTIVHEMLHQLGALDLYPTVHLQGAGGFKGPGDWDVMASGNWNQNGRRPALPTSPMLDWIGAHRHSTIDLGLPSDLDITRTLTPLSSGGQALKLPLSAEESVWLEFRAATGFDLALPGTGLLVLQRDLAVWDPPANAVNVDPRRPGLIVIEADGDGDLASGRNEGESGDVFGKGDVLGASGVEVVDAHGRLVPWTVEVLSQNDTELVVRVTGPPSFEWSVSPPERPLQLLPRGGVELVWEGVSECIPVANVTSSDQRVVAMSLDGATGDDLRHGLLTWTDGTVSGASGTLDGSLACGPEEVHVSIPWHVVGNLVTTDRLEGDIPVKKTARVQFGLEFEGVGTRRYDVVLDGPVERIATTAESQVLGNGSTLTLDIDPNGLLTPGLLAFGEVVLVDDAGLVQRVNVTLQAAGTEVVVGGGFDLSDPSTLSLLLGGFAALWVLLGMKRRPRRPSIAEEAATPPAIAASEAGGSEHLPGMPSMAPIPAGWAPRRSPDEVSGAGLADDRDMRP